MSTTEGQLYDMLHKRFGIGSYDERLSKVPAYKARATEVSKIKAMMRKRNVSMEDLLLTFEYAVAQRLPITQSWQLFDAVLDAKRAKREAEAAEAPAAVRKSLNDAAAEAMHMGEHDWAHRLYGADIESGKAVLQQWLEARTS